VKTAQDHAYSFAIKGRDQAITQRDALLAECDTLKELLLATQRTAIAVAEERDRLRQALQMILIDHGSTRAQSLAESALAEGSKQL
jgi:hypothetical protein